MFYSLEKRDTSQIISSKKLKTEDSDAFQSQVCFANLYAKQLSAAHASKGLNHDLEFQTYTRIMIAKDGI